MTNEPVSEQPAELAAIVARIAALIREGGPLTRGDVAAVRRMDPRSPAAAFFKIEGLVLDEHLPGEAAARADLETRWAAVVVGLSHLGALHQSGRRLGFALVAAKLSELRFARLLRADVDRLADELPALARFLASKGEPADWTAAASLILSAGRTKEEAVRRHLARDYYGALARQKSA